MYNQPYISLTGTLVFITSNGMPALSKDEDHQFDWEAIEGRT